MLCGLFGNNCNQIFIDLHSVHLLLATKYHVFCCIAIAQSKVRIICAKLQGFTFLVVDVYKIITS